VWNKNRKRSRSRNLAAWSAMACLLTLAACGGDPPLTSSPSFMVDYELIGCNPNVDPECKPLYLTPKQQQLVQDALFRLSCPDISSWIQDNSSILRVYYTVDDYWATHWHEENEIRLRYDVFEDQTELAMTLVHEAVHMMYPIVGYGEAGPRYFEVACVNGAY